jgi:hypothetical protein
MRGKSRKNAARGTTVAAHSVAQINPWTGAVGVERKLFVLNVNNQALNHNTPAQLGNTASLLDGLSLGTGVSNRIGNSIFVRGMSIRMVLNRKTDRPNVSYRVVVVATTPGAGVDNYVELFAGNSFCAPVYPAAAVVLHDSSFPKDQGTVMTQQATPDKERSNLFDTFLDIRKTVPYSTDGTALTVLRCYVVAYDAFGTLTSDNIASVAQGVVGVYFEDA